MKAWFPLFALLAAAPGAQAAQADDARVEAAWLRQAPPGAGMSAAFFTLHNTGRSELVLVGAASAAAGSVELHGHRHEGGVMRMRAVERLAVPPGDRVELAPGGLHLMIFELKAPLVPGSEFPLVLRFADGSTRELRAPVRAALD